MLSYHPARHPEGRRISLYSRTGLGSESPPIDNPRFHTFPFAQTLQPLPCSVEVRPQLPSSALGRIFNFIQLLDQGGFVTCEEGKGRKYNIGPHYVAACRHPVPAACFVEDSSLCISSSNYRGHRCWRCTSSVHSPTSVLLHPSASH